MAVVQSRGDLRTDPSHPELARMAHEIEALALDMDEHMVRVERVLVP